MKHKLLLAAASVAMLAAPSMAYAGDDDPGVYVRGQLGYGTHADMTFTNDLNGDVQSEGNATGSVGLGYDFGNNWRLEGDVAHLWTDLGQVGNQPSSYAKFDTTSYMINAIYDFNDFGSFSPYVGAGFGLVNGNLSAAAHDTLLVDSLSGKPVSVTNPACSFACGFKDDDNALGWQILAGLGYEISDNLTWDTQYRYLNAGDMDFEGHVSTSANPFIPLVNSQIGFAELNDIAAHSVMTGFRYKFGASTPTPPPPPPPPAVVDVTCWDGSMAANYGLCPAEPAPTLVSCWDGSTVSDASQCPAQQQTYTCWDGTLVYDLGTCPAEVVTRSGESVMALCGQEYRQEIIYYEFNKGQSAETRNTINRILDIGQYCQVGDIRVVGHTDSSGAASYNLALSKRRAKDARDELVRQGVRGEIITSEGKGETELFVQTGDGVKEQLNRRTEVLIRLNETGYVTN